jgi:hypothetical protein
MKEELQNILFEKYPKLFIQKDLDMQQTCMCWGIETGDGWFSLIDTLCETIQNYIDNNHKAQVEFVQVKEKFGTLRIYDTGAEDLIRGMLWFAGNMSATICDVCGKPGKLNDSGWLACRCEEHKTGD